MRFPGDQLRRLPVLVSPINSEAYFDHLGKLALPVAPPWWDNFLYIINEQFGVGGALKLSFETLKPVPHQNFNHYFYHVLMILSGNYTMTALTSPVLCLQGLQGEYALLPLPTFVCLFIHSHRLMHSCAMYCHS